MVHTTVVVCVGQAIGMLKGRVDLEYVASQEQHHRHRALKILNPTTDLTGHYSCVISSFNDEKIYKQKLVIYSEPQEVRVWTEQRDDKHVTVLCEVSHVYPQPQLHLHQHSSTIDSVVLGGGKVTSSQGSYNLTLEHVVEEDTLQGLTTFECQVTIPDTKVHVLGSTQYQPRVRPVEGAVTAGGSNEHSAFAILGGIALLVLWRM
ncbi:uncharacterized protein [Panulirus ornatus]|uniref:uncharacterized protein isoform X2 n=1 Tax=Panulirus ornatus TaxID=150431 RepID=UPI003A85311C